MTAPDWDRPEVALIRHMGGRVYARVGYRRWTQLPQFGQVVVTEDLVAQQFEAIAVYMDERWNTTDEIIANQGAMIRRLRAEVDLAELQNERAGVAEAERDALRAVVESVRRWADQIADHFGDKWPHTPACQGEAGCPLCMISEATSDPGEWLKAHVAEVKAEALREAAREFRDRLPDGTGNGRAYNSWRVAQMLDERADRLAPQPHEEKR